MAFVASNVGSDVPFVREIRISWQIIEAYPWDRFLCFCILHKFDRLWTILLHRSMACRTQFCLRYSSSSTTFNEFVAKNAIDLVFGMQFMWKCYWLIASSVCSFTARRANYYYHEKKSNGETQRRLMLSHVCGALNWIQAFLSGF